MITRLAAVTVYVRNQDEALRFYTEKLGLEKRSDIQVPGGIRWLTVAAKGQTDIQIVLEDVKDSGRARALSDPVGAGTTWVFYTRNCRATYREMAGRGVKFLQEPKEQSYGVEAVFEDLYGNLFALVEPRL